MIDGRRDKEKIIKICRDIQESNHAIQSGILSNRNGVPNSLPWLLTEHQSNVVQEVIRRIQIPIGFCSNINNIITKKGEFSGVKTHDWKTFIKVIILVYIYIYIYIYWYTYFLFF